MFNAFLLNHIIFNKDYLYEVKLQRDITRLRIVTKIKNAIARLATIYSNLFNGINRQRNWDSLYQIALFPLSTSLSRCFTSFWRKVVLFLCAVLLLQKFDVKACQKNKVAKCNIYSSLKIVVSETIMVIVQSTLNHFNESGNHNTKCINCGCWV